ncbi:transferase family-domain-containing protein [Usnea florida]
MQDYFSSENHLSTLEQISPQAYTRCILCFRLQSGVPQEDVTRILRESLMTTAGEIPVLNSVAVTVTDSNGRETKDVREAEFDTFTVKDLKNTSLDYDVIRSQGFPSQVFDGEALCRTGVYAVPGSPVPVFLAQANYITGGLLLGLSIWHGALDGTAITEVLRHWAQNCGALQDKEHKVSTLSGAAFDKSRLSKVSANREVSIKDHPEFLLLPEVPTSPPPAATRTVKTEIFHISPASVSALKDIASPKNASSPQTEYSWISTHTAISALIWQSVMIATYAHEHPIPDSVSIFSSPLNARKQMEPPLAPDLFASAWCFHDSRLPIKTLLEASLADIAVVVREATDKIDSKYIESLITMVDGVQNRSLLLPLVYMDVLKTCSILTSWARFPIYDFDWGNAMGGRCERVRTVSSGMFNGMHVLLPELPDEMGGGLEIVVGLEDDAMDRLKQDRVWTRFARLL